MSYTARLEGCYAWYGRMAICIIYSKLNLKTLLEFN